MGWADGHWLGWDLETTSLDTRTALPVSSCFGLFRPESPPRVSTEHFLIDPGIEVPAEAAAIHGLTTERVRAEGEDLLVSLERIVNRLMWAKELGYPLVTMNGAYDLTLVDHAARKHLGQGLVERGWEGAPVIDVFVLDKQFDTYRAGSRKLEAMAKTYGVALDLPHTAVGDVRAALAVLHRMTLNQRFRYMLRWDTARMLRTQATWKRQQMESLSEHFVSKGQDPVEPAQFHWPLYRWDATEPVDDGCG